MKITCSRCDARYKIDDSKIAGRQHVTCPKCRNRIELPPHKTAAGRGTIPSTITCPKCSFQQPRSETCVSCGIVFAKYEEINSRKDLPHGETMASPQDPPPQTAADEIQRSIVERVLYYAANNAKGTVITISVVILISFVFGGVPLLSVLFDSDEEVMFFTQKMHCNQIKKFHIEAAFFRIILGNTGTVTAKKLQIALSDIPCHVEQIYYTVKNLNAAEARSSDPEVFAICRDGSRHPCLRFIAKSFGSICDELPVYRSVALAEGPPPEEEIGPMSAPPRGRNSDPNIPAHGYLDRCEFEKAEPRAFEIENLAPGTLLHIGLMTYDYKEMRQSPWQELEKITLSFQGDVNVIKGNPQATTLAKMINAVLDIF